MRWRPSSRRRLLAAVAVLLLWSLVAVAAGLPHGSVAARLTEVALAAVTCMSALVTLGAAVPAGPLRRVWLLLGLGLAGYAGGFVVQFWVTAGEHGGPAGLNLSDCASLLLYPLADAGLLVLSRRRTGVRAAGSLLEGGMAFSGIAAVVVAVTAAAFPTLLTGSIVQVVYALAYPVGGATLLLVTVTGLSLAGGHADRVWVLLVCGFALMTVGDGLYGLASVRGTFRYGTYVDVLYTAGPVFVALAATCAPLLSAPAATRHAGLPAGLPGLATLVALAVLVAGHYTAVPALAVWSAAGCVVLAVARTWQLFAQARSLERTRVLASTDELTSLANRRSLLAAVQDRADEQLELLLLDLDGFTEVNDALGHAAGDAVLRLVAAQLRATAPGCLVARLGGDEFAILLAAARPGAAPAGPRLAAAVRAAVEQPVQVGGTRVVVGVSIGHAVLGSEPGEDRSLPAGSELLRRADLALHRSKQQRAGCVSWDAGLEQGSRNRLALLGELRQALAVDDQITAWFQPKADPVTGRVTGYEALVRWQHPTRGLLLPGEFLPALERTGLLPALTVRMLTQSVALLRRLADAGRPAHIAVNLGAPDLLDIDLPTRIAALLDRHGVDPRRLRLEVTETVIMSDPERVLATLRGLRALGVGLSLDDYGTGLSSLSYLRVLPIDELKIDRSFVTDLLTDPACALIVASTTRLAHDLHLTVVAEGVEDDATLQAVVAAGCDTVQGWYTGRPRPASAIIPDPVRSPAGAAAWGRAASPWRP